MAVNARPCHSILMHIFNWLMKAGKFNETLLLLLLLLSRVSHLWLYATPQTAAHQAPSSMGFSRQEYWSGLPLPSPTLLYRYLLYLFLLFLHRTDHNLTIWYIFLVCLGGAGKDQVMRVVLAMFDSGVYSEGSFSLFIRYNSHTIKSTLLKCVGQWVLM